MLRCTCERAHLAAIETVADINGSVVMGNEHVESFARRSSSILGCNPWLLAFQYQPALHNLGAHLRGMPGLRQGILILAPHNVSHFGQVTGCRSYFDSEASKPHVKRIFVPQYSLNCLHPRVPSCPPGLNAFILSERRGSEGLGFAIPSIKFVYEELKNYGYVHRTDIRVVVQRLPRLWRQVSVWRRTWGCYFRRRTRRSCRHGGDKSTGYGSCGR